MAVQRSRTRVTLADVAAYAKVDRSVVSRVMNKDPGLNVRNSTRDRVLAAIEALDYRPNAMARSLRTARARAYGLLIPDFSNPVYAATIKGAEAAAAEQDCLLLSGSAEMTLSSDNRPLYLDLLGQDRIDGLLLAGGGGSIPQAAERLGRMGIPWLLLNRHHPEATRYVVLDDERAATLAVRHLVDLGHHSIAHLAGPPTADTSNRREAGYRVALSGVGLDSQQAVVEVGDYSHEGGAAAMSRLLTRRQPPTAVFVANVAAAIGALSAAHRAGFDVPGQISIVAVHDLPLAAYLHPPLTTVRMPLEELGRRGIELISSLSADEPIAEVITDPIELIIRGSTAPPG